MSTDSPVFLITGCSSGLGRELSIAALKRGFRVIATARKVETLAALEQQGAKTMYLDVTASESELVEFAAKAIAVYGQVDYLVNNAGYLLTGAIEETPRSDAVHLFTTNFFGLVSTTNAFLPHFRARKTGTIINVSSEAGTLGPPGIGIYAAAKSAINAVSDSWAHELAEYNIRSVSVQPGGFRTRSGGIKAAEKSIEGYQAAHGVIHHINTTGDTQPGDPAKGAEHIVTFVTDPKHQKLPLRFVLGDEAFAGIKQAYTQRLADMEATKEWSIGTSF
ncbi:short-chain dehydrogenase/reductase family protein [Favolaschia claudopus]|uniref:Short-chain dehydrogenase/reductase family protein n=1 Tax=Favolaschia claudopus TaxID=2862362 RepID=A0AAV9ZW74_9AGAR